MTRTTDALRRAVRRGLDVARGDSGVGGAVATGPHGRAGARTGGDRGMTAIEFVFLTPVLFFMIFATVQFGMYFFADHVAQAAAQAGARKARDDADADPSGWSDKATGTARDYIHQLGPNLLDSPTVRARKTDATTVQVRVTGKVPSVFPGMKFTVHAVSQGPIERFVQDRG